MSVKLLYFAWVRERIGKPAEEVEPPAGIATVADLMAWLSRRGEQYAHAFENPRRDPHRDRSRPCQGRRGDRGRARDRVLSADDRRLSAVTRRVAQLELAMTSATISLQREPFDAAAEAAALRRGRTDIGAIVTFTGICRGDENGEPIAALTLEHYPEMAEAEIARQVEAAQARWSLLGLRVIHRFGRIEPGAEIVLVVTASSHRHDAFAAAEFLMDYLKTRAPFWKQVERAGGKDWVAAKQSDDTAAERWVRPDPRAAE